LRKLAAIVLCLSFLLSLNSVQVQAYPPPVPELKRLEKFLINQINADLGLVRESPDSSIPPTYWLMSDNLLAHLALRPYHREESDLIKKSLEKYGYLRDGLHEVLLGEKIPLPLLTPRTVTVTNGPTYSIKTEVRDGKLMDDWIDYADLLLYVAVSEENGGRREMAKHYFYRARDLWNGIGLFDKPTRQDGFYSTYKLALLLYVSRLLQEPLPYTRTLEEILWRFQREDGGARSHYLGNFTSNREANTETASIILIAYNYGFDKAHEMLFTSPYPEVFSDKEVERRKQWFTNKENRDRFLNAKKFYDDAVKFFEARSFEQAIVAGKDATSLYWEAVRAEERYQEGTREAIRGSLFLASIMVAFLLVYWRRHWILRLIRRSAH